MQARIAALSLVVGAVLAVWPAVPASAQAPSAPASEPDPTTTPAPAPATDSTPDPVTTPDTTNDAVPDTTPTPGAASGVAPSPEPADAGVTTAGTASSLDLLDRLPNKLGTYEKQALTRALDRTGLRIDPSPEGKVLRKIHVINFEVFSPRDGILQMFNFFHLTTRDHVIRREVLLQPGQTWDPSVVEETERKLRDPVFSTLAVVVPVRAADGATGQVDMLVITRDVWSLRLNSDFELQQSKLTFLLIAPSENNLLGLRKLFAGIFEMDQGEYSAGFLYLDKNLMGKNLRLSAEIEGIFRRETGEFGGEANEYEGERITAVFQRPFWSIASRWSAAITAFHEDRVLRVFDGTVIDQYMVPDVDANEQPIPCAGAMLPFAFRRRQASVQTSGSHQLGTGLKHRFSLGHRLRVDRPSFVDGFPDDPCQRDNFSGDLFTRSERTSEVFAEYRIFENNFAKLRNIDTYDLPEDAQFGPRVTAVVSASLEPIGSETTFGRASLDLGWVFPWGDTGFLSVAADASTRIDGELVDNVFSAGTRFASPMISGLFRVVARSDLTLLTRDRSNVVSRVRLGGANGLRGFDINFFPRNSLGNSDQAVRVIANLELRSAPFHLGFTRGGGLLFFDVGDVNATVGDLRVHADAGLGFRFLIPQLSSLVYRLDWALPLEGAVFPGRFIFGAGQEF